MADPFVAAVRDAPDDDLPRLIYADYLEERGDPRGPFIRAQVELARADADDPQRDELAGVEAELLARHEAEWVGSLADRLYRWWFHRGFLEVSLDVKRFVREKNEWLDQPTVGGVLLYAPPSMSSHLLDELAWSIEAVRVRSLHLGFEWLRDGGVMALLDSPWLLNLVELDLRTNGLTDAAAIALARTPHLPGLRDLSLANNLIGDAGAAALVRRPGLRRLDLTRNEITAAGERALASSAGRVPVVVTARPPDGYAPPPAEDAGPHE
jgi:uncharacterized protein (TIGR02996 family)